MHRNNKINTKLVRPFNIHIQNSTHSFRYWYEGIILSLHTPDYPPRGNATGDPGGMLAGGDMGTALGKGLEAKAPTGALGAGIPLPGNPGIPLPVIPLPVIPLPKKPLPVIPVPVTPLPEKPLPEKPLPVFLLRVKPPRVLVGV